MLHVTKVRRLKKAARNVNRVKLERLVMLRVGHVVIAVLVNTVKVKKTTVKRQRTPLFVLVAPPVGRPKQAVPNANRVKQVLLVMLRVMTVKIAILVNTVKAKKTTVLTSPIQRFVLIAQRGIHQVRVVPSANPVGRGRPVLGVKSAVKVNTATVLIQELLCAAIAQPGTTATTSVKVLVCPAVRVNSTT